MPLEQLRNCRELGLACDKSSTAEEQVIGMSIEALERREIRPEVGVNELEHMLRLAEVLQAVRAKVAKRGALRERICDEARRNTGQQGLLAVPEGPSRAARKRAEPK